jgi:leucine dehydrogenase
MAFHELMAQGGHRRLLAVQDRACGLRAWIALHHVERGPAYGGIRVWSYRSEREAVVDALRLSRAMTYKCVLAGVKGGGAKTVVLADELTDRAAAMEQLGREIEALNGAYQAGPDVGFTTADGRALARGTRFLAHHAESGAGTLRPAGEATAEGAEWGIRAAMREIGLNGPQGTTIAIQGLGSVGLALARRMKAAGARVVGADPREERAETARGLGVEMVEPTGITEIECDVYVPAALGGVVHDVTVSRLRARMVAGVANNPLSSDAQAEQLAARGILFVPDFILNAGALIEGECHRRTGRTSFEPELRRIGDTVAQVIHRAKQDGLSPLAAARAMAEEILADERRTGRTQSVETAARVIE